MSGEGWWFPVIFMAALTGLFPVTMWAIEPAKYETYRCADRGGIKQAIGDKYGQIESMVCNDGTVQSSRVLVHHAGLKGVGEDR